MPSAPSPLARFLKLEAASGIVLLVATALALVLANSPLAASYGALWRLPIHLPSFERDLQFWINDGVMTVFFFSVGLEIRKELYDGELSQARRAGLPLVAALGGTVAPAVIYTAFNHGHASVKGWGIPMATDIAFAVGVITLLGRRLPAAIRVLLLALAVIDDVAAILVIALFYSSGFVASGFVIVAVGVALVLLFRRLGAQSPLAYVLPGVVVWGGMYRAGVHPTLAGVLLGLLTPVHSVGGASVVGKLQHALHGWVSFGIMPLFALANAGVTLDTASLGGASARVFAGIALGLVLGKPLGVVGLSWLAARVGLVELPSRVYWRHLWVLGLAAGIGFTMALFIAALAFGESSELKTAKLAVLAASTFCGTAAYLAGRAFRAPS